MGRAEGGSVPSEVGYVEGVPSPAEVCRGSAVSSLSGVRGGAPAENECWRILKDTLSERSFCTYDKI